MGGKKKKTKTDKGMPVFQKTALFVFRYPGEYFAVYMIHSELHSNIRG